MANIGVLIETDNGKMKPTNFGVLTAAVCQAEDNQVYALLLEGDAESFKGELEAYGVQNIVTISSEADVKSSPDIQARLMAEAIKEYAFTAMLGLAGDKSRDLFARLAALLDLPLASDCIAVDLAAKQVVKSHFSGKTFATIRINSELLLCTVRPNVIEALKKPATAKVLEFTAQVEEPGLVRVVDVKQGASDKVDLTEANIIITGGRPIGSADNYKMLEDCAGLLGAAVGASRASVDAGFAPHSMQIGQTGKTVSPKLYIGCGLSGSVQHFAGMKTSKIIVAVNTDKDAPIFEKSDYGIVGDMFEIVPLLTEVLQQG